MSTTHSINDSLQSARDRDQKDALHKFRNEFVFPKTAAGQAQLYFAGHSLGLMPRKAQEYVTDELRSWGEHGVEGHFAGAHPWLPYHENITESFARLVGAKDSEVVAMNTLTVNLHLLLVSFYRPTKKRYKILIENNAFPSDKYAVDSQARFHGFDPKHTVVELRPRAGEITVSTEDLLAQIDELGDELALVLLGNCNYLSGQCFDFQKITERAHAVGALAGFNLAHGAGNLFLKLHDWDVDFAVWCSYKYLNSGPGGIAGAFIHERHLGQKDLPRFEGWWGHNKKTRFQMGPQFDPLPTAEAWQLSNPPILQLASLRASMEIFDRAGMQNLAEKSTTLTQYFENEIKSHLAGDAQIITPSAPERGAMLCLRFQKSPRLWIKKLHESGAILDFREPDIIRATPVPLYNSYEDVHQLVQLIKKVIHSS